MVVLVGSLKKKEEEGYYGLGLKILKFLHFCNLQNKTTNSHHVEYSWNFA